MRRVGTLRRLRERNDTEYLLRSPENARRLLAAIKEMDEGGGRPTTLEEIRARLGLAPKT